jgi:glycosyltransferase involved in cell wall biosynthesis
VRPGLVWRVLRAEGVAGAANRLRDRLAEGRRRRCFRAAAAPPPGFSCAVLNFAAGAPAPSRGGVQAQLLWRLAAEAARRPVALLYPEEEAAGSGYRLELQSGGERRALRLPPAGAAARPGGTARSDPAVLGGRAGGPRDIGDSRGPGDPRDQGGPRDQGDPGATGDSGGHALATALEDPELERAVAWAAAQCGATALHVEGLAGMPLGSLLRLRQAGMTLVLAVHDFAAFCPRPHLLEAVAPPSAAAAPHFCHYSRDAARCACCLGRDAAGLAPDYQESRRELARQLLASAAAVVYPSSFLAHTYDELFAGASGAAARVIAPAPSPALAASRPRAGVPGAGSPPAVAASPPRHIAWVGAVHAHKGALVFEAAVQRLAAAGRRPRLSAYGGGDPEILARWRRLHGLRVRGYYRSGSLPELLRRDGVDLALLLSVVPESYSLILDECAAAAVPVVAFDLGAPAERIAAAGSGVLLAASLADDPAAAGAALATLLADLLDGRLEVLPPPLSPAPAQPSASPSQPAGPAVAAAAWIDLYRQLGLPVPG